MHEGHPTPNIMSLASLDPKKFNSEGRTDVLILFRLFCQFGLKIPWEFDKFVNMKIHFFIYFV